MDGRGSGEAQFVKGILGCNTALEEVIVRGTEVTRMMIWMIRVG